MPRVLKGLIPAAHTPFHTDGKLNLAAVSLQADLYRESGVAGVFLCGTTGEWASMAVDERRTLLESWLDVANTDMTIAAHVGHHCQSDAIALAAHARDVGADAVAVMAPSYFKAATIRDVVEFCRPIAAAAEPLPFYYYHIPGMTGVRLSPADVLHEARFRIPTLKGLKFSDSDPLELQRAIAIDDGAFDVFLGCDEGLLAGYLYGIKGSIGATYSFTAPHFERMRKAFAAGDVALARALQLQAALMVKTLADFGFLAATKAVMKLIGVDCGPMRSPIASLSDSETRDLAQKLAVFDVFARPFAR